MMPTGRLLSADCCFHVLNVFALLQVKALVQGCIKVAPANMDHMIYMVLAGADVMQTGTATFCTKACGWHTYFPNNGTNVKYGFVGGWLLNVLHRHKHVSCYGSS